MIVNLTVWSPINVEKFTVRKWTVTVRANKTIWMPLYSKGCDVVGRYGQIATGALVSKQLKEVILAVGFSVLLVESFVGVKLTTTMGTNKVLWMKSLLQCNCNFL